MSESEPSIKVDELEGETESVQSSERVLGPADDSMNEDNLSAGRTSLDFSYNEMMEKSQEQSEEREGNGEVLQQVEKQANREDKSRHDKEIKQKEDKNHDNQKSDATKEWTEGNKDIHVNTITLEVGETLFAPSLPLILTPPAATERHVFDDDNEDKIDDKQVEGMKIYQIEDIHVDTDDETIEKDYVVDNVHEDYYNNPTRNGLNTYMEYDAYQDVKETDSQFLDNEEEEEHISSVSENEEEADRKNEHVDVDDDVPHRINIFPSLSTLDLSSRYKTPEIMRRGKSEELLTTNYDNISLTTSQLLTPAANNPSQATSLNKLRLPTTKFSTKANSFKHHSSTPSLRPFTPFRWSHNDLRASNLFDDHTSDLVDDIKCGYRGPDWGTKNRTNAACQTCRRRLRRLGEKPTTCHL